MRQDPETSTIIATQDIEEEGVCSDGNAATGGESGGVWQYGEHREVVQEVCEALDTVCGGWGQGQVQKLLGKTLWVFTCAGEGGGGQQRWTIVVPAGEGSGWKPDEGAGKEGQKADYAW